MISKTRTALPSTTTHRKQWAMHSRGHRWKERKPRTLDEGDSTCIAGHGDACVTHDLAPLDTRDRHRAFQTGLKTGLVTLNGHMPLCMSCGRGHHDVLYDVFEARKNCWSFDTRTQDKSA